MMATLLRLFVFTPLVYFFSLEAFAKKKSRKQAIYDSPYVFLTQTLTLKPGLKAEAGLLNAALKKFTQDSKFILLTTKKVFPKHDELSKIPHQQARLLLKKYLLTTFLKGARWSSQFQDKILRKAEIARQLGRIYVLAPSVSKHHLDDPYTPCSVVFDVKMVSLKHYLKFSKLGFSTKQVLNHYNEVFLLCKGQTSPLGFLTGLGKPNTWLYKKTLERLLYNIRRVFDKSGALIAPVEHAGFHSLRFRLGKKEGLKLNQMLDIYAFRKSHKHYQHVGLARVTSVADNRLHCPRKRECKRVNPNSPPFSTATIIKTNGIQTANKGFFVREHKKHGVEFSLRGTATPYLKPTSQKESNFFGFNLVPGFSIHVEVDYSDELSIPDFHFLYEFQIEIPLFTYDEVVTTYTTPHVLAGLRWGVLKKFRFRQIAFLLGGTVNLGFTFESQVTMKGKERNVEHFGALHLGLSFITGLDIFLNSSASWVLRGGFRADLPIQFPGRISPYLPVGPWFQTGLNIKF